MAHMMTRMTRMTRWLDSHDSLARWLAVCQDPQENGMYEYNVVEYNVVNLKCKNCLTLKVFNTIPGFLSSF